MELLMDNDEIKFEDCLPKIQLRVIEEDSDDLALEFTWDETDPALQEWTDLDDKEREELILNALKRGVQDD